MSTKKPDMTLIPELPRAEQIKHAKNSYLAELRVNPSNVSALHALGMIALEENDVNDAMHYLEKAMEYQPDNRQIALHLANMYKRKKLFREAVSLLEKIIIHHPDYAPAFNNRGTVYYSENKWDDAIVDYRRAIAISSTYIDAHYNLGLALIKIDQKDEAISHFEKVLADAPDHLPAAFHLACLFMEKQLFEKAIQLFLAIEKMDPFHFEMEVNLATCYLKQGKSDEAKSHYVKALELRRDEPQVLFNLGVIYMQRGAVDTAIQFYQRALISAPHDFATHNNLGVLFLAKEHIGFALKHFQEALKMDPDNIAIGYTVQSLLQNERLVTAPPHFVETLFDAYADHYETHLLTALDYKLPDVLKQSIGQILSKHRLLDMLDLGCGTGLCGVPLKPYAASFIGVDLSSRMLALASEKRIYDILIKAEFVEYLTDKIEQYDLIIAGDALVYKGDLAVFFEKVRIALRQSGFFIFNSEICENEEYKMNQSGRFSHQKYYLDNLAEHYQLSIVLYQECITRMQHNQPVYGHFYILQRKNTVELVQYS